MLIGTNTPMMTILSYNNYWLYHHHHPTTTTMRMDRASETWNLHRWRNHKISILVYQSSFSLFPNVALSTHICIYSLPVTLLVVCYRVCVYDGVVVVLSCFWPTWLTDRELEMLDPHRYCEWRRASGRRTCIKIYCRLSSLECSVRYKIYTGTGSR